MIIQQLAAPRVGKPDALYFRRTYDTENGAYSYYDSHRSRYVLQQGTTIEFSTYFNSFAVAKWNALCGLKDLSINIESSGELLIEVVALNTDASEFALLTTTAESSDVETTTLQLDTSNLTSRLIFLKITALSAHAELVNYNYSTNKPAKRDVSLAILSATYCREDYITRNIATVIGVAKDLPLHYFISDNGRTLELENTAATTIVPNKNLGGAGGFGRCAIEAQNHPTTFTHAIFADDDIEFDPSIFYKLSYFLSHVDDDSAAVSGAMIKINEPHIQYENGAAVDGEFNFKPLKQELDLTEKSALVENDLVTGDKLYAGWWFCCVPFSLLNERLPLPVFYKFDDVEFSLRLKAANIKIHDLNGVGVWHEPFDFKYASNVFYYEERNCFITRSVHDQQFDYKAFKRRLRSKVYNFTMGYRYDSAEKALMGSQHALLGAGNLKEIDMETFHTTICSSQTDKAVPKETTGLGPLELTKMADKRHFLIRLISKLTLNGHLLPNGLRRLFGKSPYTQRVLKPFDWDHLKAFGASHIVYYNPDNNSCFTTHKQVLRLFKIFARLLMLELTSKSKFLAAKASYAENYDEITNHAYWLKHLEIEPPSK